MKKQEHDHGGEQPLKQTQQSNSIERTNGEYPKISSYAAEASKYLATQLQNRVTESDYTFKVCFSINLLEFLLQFSPFSKAVEPITLIHCC